jgi:hypothetical protein
LVKYNVGYSYHEKVKKLTSLRISQEIFSDLKFIEYEMILQKEKETTGR